MIPYLAHLCETSRGATDEAFVLIYADSIEAARQIALTWCDTLKIGVCTVEELPKVDTLITQKYS